MDSSLGSYQYNRPYCLESRCEKDEQNNQIAYITINQYTTVQCKIGENYKRIDLSQGNYKDHLSHKFKTGEIYCPDNIERFCQSTEIEYFHNDGAIPYENTKKIHAVSPEQKGKSAFTQKIERLINEGHGRVNRQQMKIDLWKALASPSAP